MREHWDEVKRVFDLLGYIVKDSDPDGIELFFTKSAKQYKSTATTKLMKTIEERRLEGSTNIGSRLGDILQKYQGKLDNQAQSRSLFSLSRSELRPMNIYVLTDGLWQPKSDAEAPIKNLVSKLKERGKLKEQVGIQFIQFGNDAEATERLKRLDSGLNLGAW
jgi:hypothetical protein